MRIARLAGKGSHRGRPCVSRGGADDGQLLAPSGQHLVEHRGQELHREVFEGQGRPMEELEQPVVGVELPQRSDCAMGERSVGLMRERPELLLVEAAFREGREQPGREVGIGKLAHRLEVAGLEGRPARRHEKPAILGETGEQDILEASLARLAAGAHIDGHVSSWAARGT